VRGREEGSTDLKKKIKGTAHLDISPHALV
jgi:hypothetical protein